MGGEEVGPEWLDREFLESVLEGETVLKSAVTAATGKGDNYLSMMLRVELHVKGEPSKRFLIVKTPPAVEFMRQMVDGMGAFDKETAMYHRVLPAMYRLYEKRTLRPAEPLAPRAFVCPRGQTLVLEDLKQSGYAMADRLRGLDAAYASLALRAMGRLHALSVALHREDPLALAAFTERMFVEEKRDMVCKFLELQMKMLARTVADWPGYERFEERLTRAAERSVDWTTRCMKPESSERPVLNHGDCWLNNMMFLRAEDGSPAAVRFVDFQISRRASPAVDLLYFLFTSVRFRELQERWEDLLRAYLDAFNALVRDLGLPDAALSYQELAREVDERMLYGLVVSCTVLVPVLATPEHVPDFQNLSFDSIDVDMKKEDNPMDKSFSSPHFVAAFKKRLLYFENKGVI